MRRRLAETYRRLAVQAPRQINERNTMNTAYLNYAWKSILAFLSLLATNVAGLLVTEHQPLPQNGGQWATFAVTTIGGTWLVWQKGNGPKP